MAPQNQVSIYLGRNGKFCVFRYGYCLVLCLLSEYLGHIEASLSICLLIYQWKYFTCMPCCAHKIIFISCIFLCASWYSMPSVPNLPVFNVLLMNFSYTSLGIWIEYLLLWKSSLISLEIGNYCFFFPLHVICFCFLWLN